MLLDREEMERRLGSSKNLLNNLPPRDNSVRVHPNHGGRAIGSKNAPTSLKIIAGVLAKTEKVSEVAEALDLSPKVVESSKNSKNEEIRSAVEHTTERIRDMALEKLMASLGIINGETLANVSAKDASTVAKNLAGVVNQLSPREQSGLGQVSLVLYAPKQRNEDHYNVIDISVAK